MTYEVAVGVVCLSCGLDGVGVKAHAEGFDYCRDCYYTGRAEEHRQAGRVAFFRSAFPAASFVGVEHTGGGCFWLAVRFADGVYYTASNEAAVPAAGEPWNMVCRNSDDEGSPDYDGTMVAGDVGVMAHDGPSGDLTDQQVVDAIRADLERIRQ